MLVIMTCQFSYALLQQLQNDLDTLKCTVHVLRSTMMMLFLATVNSMGAVLSSAVTPLTNVFLHLTFTDCMAGTLSYLDDFSVPQNLEDTLDSKLTVEKSNTCLLF